MQWNLLKSVREYKKYAILTPIFVVLEVLMEVLIPYMMSKIIDNGIVQGDIGYILKVGFILFIMALIALYFGVKSGNYAAIAGSGFGKNLREDVFYKIQEFSFKNIDRFSTPGLVTRLTTDITNVQMAFMMSIRILARTPIMAILSLVMVFTINVRIALIILAILPILFLILIFIAKKAHPRFIKVFDEYDRLNNVVKENVNAQRVVKAYVREDYEIDKFHNISESIYNLFSRASKLVAWNSPIMNFTIYALVLSMIAIGGRSIVRGDMMTGELTSIVIYAIQILMSLMMVTFVFIMIMISEASRERINEVFEEEPVLKNKEDAVTEVKDGSVDFEHVDFCYGECGDNLALEDINLHIDSGEVVGIIGGTGSGKTTMVQLIPRLYDVSSGSVKVGGVDVRDYDRVALRDEVAMVLQKNTLFSGTIYDNIRWGDENATDEEVEEVCRLAQADPFIQELPDKYNTMVLEGGSNFSGGQKQRLTIARALLKRPKILILDDSTSAVDTKTEAKIRKAFHEDIPNTTTLIISQRIASIEDADKIVVMENGRIDGVGTSEELLRTNKIYQEIYESQVKGGGEDE